MKLQFTYLDGGQRRIVEIGSVPPELEKWLEDGRAFYNNHNVLGEKHKTKADWYGPHDNWGTPEYREIECEIVLEENDLKDEN
jgi:hypothetical protein